MGNEVLPAYVGDHGMWYSTASSNFYGYYCTGLESPGESDDHHRFFGSDGQDLLYSGMQTESLPYVYYTPNYEYAHSPYSQYNPCNPCMPGAVIGVDSPCMGTQHYFTNAAYQQPVSPAPFIPVAVQPGANFIANVAPEPLVFNPMASGACGVDAVSIKLMPPAPVGVASSMQLSDPVTLGPQLPQISPVQFPLLSKVPKGFQADATHIKQLASDGAVACTHIPLITPAKDSAGIIRVLDQVKGENPHTVRSQLKVTAPTYYGSNAFAKPTVDRVRPMFQSGEILRNARGSPTTLVEQNRGPRMDRSKRLWTSLVVKSYTTKTGTSNAEENITICPHWYNREDFPVNYPDAKFFVIKSYSEDDVHKSIKYSVWSSTSSGNKRLDSAYEEAQKISGGNKRKCPVFLFFSVNGSGQFCGVAEMISSVDFNRDMDFWQQDKWIGSFPVRWHIIKDVPNTSFRHIILENNENRPVTNSRDTQEVKYMPGISMLNIFKNSPLRTSILDDFMHYEERQRIMYEEKSRLFGRKYGASLFLSAFTPHKSNVRIKCPLNTEEKPAEPGHNMMSSDITLPLDDKITSKVEDTDETNDKESTMLEVTQEAGDVNSVMKIGSLSIDSREGETDQSATLTVTAETVEYVTVGSMPIKVDRYGRSGMLTVGTIPIHPKAAKQTHLSSVSASKEEGLLKST